MFFNDYQGISYSICEIGLITNLIFKNKNNIIQRFKNTFINIVKKNQKKKQKIN